MLSIEWNFFSFYGLHHMVLFVSRSYLQEAVCAVDLIDPVTKEHAPTVMSQLVRQLQTQVSAYGSGALSSQIRLLLLAAQRLQKA
jgi:enhancer of mRNA-decapping protein 4